MSPIIQTLHDLIPLILSVVGAILFIKLLTYVTDMSPKKRKYEVYTNLSGGSIDGIHYQIKRD